MSVDLVALSHRGRMTQATELDLVALSHRGRLAAAGALAIVYLTYAPIIVPQTTLAPVIATQSVCASVFSQFDVCGRMAITEQAQALLRASLATSARFVDTEITYATMDIQPTTAASMGAPLSVDAMTYTQVAGEARMQTLHQVSATIDPTR